MTSPFAQRFLSLVPLAFIAAIIAFVPIPLCPWAAILHIPCPGCGMTRATLALLSGNLREALHYHPLAPIVVPFFAVYMLAHSISYVRHGVSRVDLVLRGPWINGVLILLLVAMLGLWVARFFGAFGGPVPLGP